MIRQPHRPRRFPYNPWQARTLASDIIETCAAEVDREYTLASTWRLISDLWPLERKSVMREVIYRRCSWF